MIDKIIEITKKEFILPEKSIHGISHWEAVDYNGMFLAQQSGVDPVVVKLFSYFHDCKREDDWEDPLHGERAAEFIQSLRTFLLKDLSLIQFNTLIEACNYHHHGMISKNPTLGACFDADRLELTRCGILPKIEFMSTQLGKRIVEKMIHSTLI